MNVIFDWSGTLCDDQQFTWSLTNQTLAHFGAENIDYDTYRREFTLPVSGFYQKYCPDVPIKDIDHYFFQAYLQNISRGPLFEKCAETLKALAKDNRLYLLSSLSEEILRAGLEYHGLTGLFQKICGASFNKQVSLSLLIESENLILSETIYIGDMPHDIESAGACRIQSGAVIFGYTPADKLKKTRPDHLFSNFSELGRHFEVSGQIDTINWPICTVGGLVFNDDKKALLVKTDKWSGLYGTPGGKVDYGETLEEAFRREIKEETGLEIDNIRFVFYQDCIEHPEFYKPRHFILMNYIAHYKSGNVRLNFESVESTWSTLEGALDLPLNGPTRILIEELLNRPKEFF